MKVDNFGQIIITEQEAFEALYSGKIQNLENILIDGNISQYNNARSSNADHIPKLKSLDNIEHSSIELFDQTNQSNWFMPKNYCPNLIDFLYSKCHTEKEKERVKEELELFVQYKMFDLLFYLKYLVDTMKSHNIVWGVGRGSSVASYVLYLIGVHKIDSLRYNLDIKEFFK